MAMPRVRLMRQARNVLARLVKILRHRAGVDNKKCERVGAWRTEPVFFHLIAVEK